MALVSGLYASQALEARRAAGVAKVQADVRGVRKRKPSACTVYDGAGNVVRVDPRRKRVKWDGDHVAKGE